MSKGRHENAHRVAGKKKRKGRQEKAGIVAKGGMKRRKCRQ